MFVKILETRRYLIIEVLSLQIPYADSVGVKATFPYLFNEISLWNSVLSALHSAIGQGESASTPSAKTSEKIFIVGSEEPDHGFK